MLLHAGIADRSMWSDLLEPLAGAGYRAVALDLPGFGEAPVSEGEQAPWMDVLGALDELGIDRTALVGNSFGGAVALRSAVVAPERVSKLVLVSAPAPGLEPSAELEQAWEAEESALERGDLDEAVAAVIETWTLPCAPTPLRERIAAMQRRAYAQQSGADSISEAADPVEEDPSTLAALEIPTLVAVGDRGQAGLPPRRRVPGPNPAGGSSRSDSWSRPLAPLETPDRFRELLLDFLGEPD